ncbi:MAG TPA: hypothetical protein VMM93_14420 [Vicinamibacterales bacterium]|nr:hypothetical protein [Vicinamibacterales bacterium]
MPTGARTPAPAAAVIWAGATDGCRAVTSWSATLRVAGRVDGERIPTGLVVHSGLVSSGHLRLEGRVLNRLGFTLAGSADRALLRLEREREYVLDRAGAILSALLGTDLGADRLLSILTGCGTPEAAIIESAQVGAFLEVSTGGGQVYLQREGAAWRPVAALTSGFQVEYRRFDGPWPADVRIWSDPSSATPVELRVGIENVVINPRLREEAFAVEPPDGWQRVELVSVRRGIGAGGS